MNLMEKAGNSLPEDGATLEHFVSSAAFDPQSAENLTPAQEEIYLASQWRLMWWKFKAHKIALVSAIFLCALYLTIPFSEFIAPYDYTKRFADEIHSPPQGIHLFHMGTFQGPFVYGRTYQLDMETLKRQYPVDKTQIYPISFFCQGSAYKLLGFFDANRHLFCVADGGSVHIAGTDRLGRDLFSRIVHGTRISLTIGLMGVMVSFILGISIGGMAGYFGGWIDNVVQRAIEVLQSIPSIPLWLALAAIMPVTWSPLVVYFGITIILGLLDWTGLARAVRSKLLALREEDYIQAAELMGASPARIIFRHLVPGFMSHLIASATITIPSMILGETALSFLGLGLRAPITSWGVLLNDAQNISAVALYPWMILPVVPVVLVILAFNFMGDGMRDAADPYK